MHIASLHPQLPAGLHLSGVSVRGNLRPILQMDLASYPTQRSRSLALHDILERVIVDPSIDSSQQRRAAELLLKQHDLGHVVVEETNIPFRRSV